MNAKNITIPKGFSSMSAEEAIESLREEFLPPEEVRMHQALSDILETLKDITNKSKGKKMSGEDK